MIGAEPKLVRRGVFDSRTVQWSAADFAAIGNGFDKVLIECTAAAKLIGIHKSTAFDAIQLLGGFVIFIAKPIGAQDRRFNLGGIVTGNSCQCVDKQALAVASFSDQAKYLLLRNISAQYRISCRFLQIMQKLMIIHAALSYKLVPVGAVRHSGRIPVWPCNHVIANLDFSTGNFGK